MAERMSERRTALLGALLATIGPISMSIYTPAMPELVAAFRTTEGMIKLTLSLYFAGFSVAQLLSGPLSDAFGRRRAVLAFIGINAVGGVICSLSPSVEWLLAGRLVQGIGASVGITVARAMVRDQFTGEAASRIMNLIGIMLAVGPALAPTLGGLALAAFGWQAIFLMLIGFSSLIILSVTLLMRETTEPDPMRAAPRRILNAYRMLLVDRRFLSAAGVLAGAVGSLYAQSTMLPFILIDRVGLSPLAFAVGMLMQSGFYFLGSVILRVASPRLGGLPAVRIGLLCLIGGGFLIALISALLTPSYASVMGPIALTSFGIAFLTPHMTTAALQGVPHVAGAASALIGFLQLGTGFAGGLFAALVGEPLTAFGLIVPAFCLAATLSFLVFRQVTPEAMRHGA